MAEQATMPFDSRVLVFRPAPNQDARWFFLKDDAEYLHKILEAIASAKTRMVYLPKRGRWSTAWGPILRPEGKHP